MTLLRFKLARVIILMALLPALLQFTAGCQMTKLTAAAREGDLVTINRLLNEGAKVDELPEGKWKATALYWSLFSCKYEAAELLLKKGGQCQHSRCLWNVTVGSGCLLQECKTILHRTAHSKRCRCSIQESA